MSPLPILYCLYLTISLPTGESSFLHWWSSYQSSRSHCQLCLLTTCGKWLSVAMLVSKGSHQHHWIIYERTTLVFRIEWVVQQAGYFRTVSSFIRGHLASSLIHDQGPESCLERGWGKDLASSQSPHLDSQGFCLYNLVLATRMGFPQGLFWEKGCADNGAMSKIQWLGVSPEFSGIENCSIKKETKQVDCFTIPLLYFRGKVMVKHLSGR